ncbi:hypothetical protein [Pedobacter sp. GR22-10]|uniref:hypothetical protein n=1 Tax=Pedobacter sp. GR22-10 TaxID=2994472 RepID=UPI0022484985|nr:hypothetical protein [Pedobacter sp. GR22-10]MCX2429887.1 hypothetical protein [Pedobacter sp. GR22-10]
MEIKDLWNKLSPRSETLQTLKKDLGEGKAPELPYFIIDQNEAKEKIGASLSQIDGERMLTNMILGQYGNGKTNLLKYLKLFFDSIKGNVDFIYTRADIEQPDLILYLLRIIQDKYTNDLILFIENLRNEEGLKAKFANNFEDNFSQISDYVNELWNPVHDQDAIKKLIYLGTGRLYTIGSFTSFGLQKLENFNRREVLVLFLNILAHKSKYVVFSIDEIEKIFEKSKARFSQFLTSYRELIDLFNKIKGHLLLTCITDASGRAQLQNANEAFYTRINPHIVELPNIYKKEDIEELIVTLDQLFQTNKGGEISVILQKVLRKKHQRNRDLLRHVGELLITSTETETADEQIAKFELADLFLETKKELEIEGSLTALHNRFFDPLQYYLEANSLLELDNKLDKRNNYFFDELNKRTHLFLFNENIEIDMLNKKLNSTSFNDNQLLIYSPIKLELSNSQIKFREQNPDFKIIDYDPESLFIYLIMYRDNLDKQEQLASVISAYTQNYL